MGKQFEGREAGRTQEGGGAGVCTTMHRKDPFVKKMKQGNSLLSLLPQKELLFFFFIKMLYGQKN